MKGFTVALFCFIAVVQGRVANAPRSLSEGTLAVTGENPWILHIRSVQGNGSLSSCAGVLIDNSWILTTATCLQGSTFNWVRYGTVNVVNPSLVTESRIETIHPTADIALIDINRVVHSTDAIGTIPISTADVSEARVCGWGADEQNRPGELLRCTDVTVSGSGVSGVQLSQFDGGVPVVANGELVGLLTGQSGTLVRTSDYAEWIASVTGLQLRAKINDQVRVVEA